MDHNHKKYPKIYTSQCQLNALILAGASPAYEKCSGPMVQYYCHGFTILTHPITVRTLKVGSTRGC